jgi:hypothetical protein
MKRCLIKGDKAMFRKLTAILIVVAIVILSAVCAWAEEITLPVTEYSTLASTGSSPRLVMQFSMPANLSDTTLIFAELSFGITPEYDVDSILQFECSRVVTTWETGNADWNTPWTNPGGDYDTTMAPAIFATSDIGAQSAYFDITEIVKGWLRDSISNRGLIFIVPDRILSRFIIGSLPGLPENAIATVKFVTQ